MEDVVKIFLDEEGHGTHYKEDEFSPRNVMFDALIEKKPGEPPVVRTYWDDNGLGSTGKVMEDGSLVYDIVIAIRSFDNPPVPGTGWRMDFYRIDTDPQGKRALLGLVDDRSGRLPHAREVRNRPIRLRREDERQWESRISNHSTYPSTT
jgi:hypothetical protein